jgi:hypothetical protein
MSRKSYFGMYSRFNWNILLGNSAVLFGVGVSFWNAFRGTAICEINVILFVFLFKSYFFGSWYSWYRQCLELHSVCRVDSFPGIYRKSTSLVAYSNCRFQRFVCALPLATSATTTTQILQSCGLLLTLLKVSRRVGGLGCRDIENTSTVHTKNMIAVTRRFKDMHSLFDSNRMTAKLR